MFRVGWHMLLENPLSLVSYSRNREFPIKSYDQFIGNYSGGQQSRETSSEIHSDGTFHIAFPYKLYFVFIEGCS